MTSDTAPSSTPRIDTYRLLNENRDHLNSSIKGLSPDQTSAMVDGDWSIKDILTHITSWEEMALLDLDRIKRGRLPALACNVGEATDKWNDLLMSVRRGFPLDQVLAEFKETHEAIIRELEQIPDLEFEPGFLRGTCQINAFHDYQHAQQIQQWREKEGI